LCRFNTTAGPATFVSSTLLQCTAPKHGEGWVDVEVTMQEHDYSSSGIQFQYQAVTINRLFPLSGPVEGNTTVVVVGANFAPPCINCMINKDLWCKFGKTAKVPPATRSAASRRRTR
jgi:hypothetical protein